MKIDIVICTDTNYIMPCGILFYSICKNNLMHNIVFHAVIDDSVTKTDKEFLNLTVNQFNMKVEYHLVDGHLFDSFPNLGTGVYVSKATYYRLYLTEILPQSIDKILYLDIDMMANGDIAELYNTDILDYEYAAVKEKYGCWLIRPDYINAGMLLLNMNKIKETKLLEKSRKLIKTKKMLFADQDAIFWSTTKKKLLPRIFNEQSKFNKKDTIICHFSKRLMFLPYPHTENYKQWQVEEVHKVLKCYYFDEDLNEYIKLKNEFETRKEEKINE